MRETHLPTRIRTVLHLGAFTASSAVEDALTSSFMKSVSGKYKVDPYGMIVVPEVASFDGVTVRLKLATDDLEERYAEPLSATEASVQELGKKVAEHLKATGMKV